MSPRESARRLTIIIGADDVWRHKPLYNEIVHRAHAAGLAGASVFHGIEGYGATSHIHTTRILSLSEDLPVAIVIVDDPAGDRGIPPPARRADHRRARGARRCRGRPLRGARRRARGGTDVTVLLIAIGAAMGAPARYLTDRFVQARHDTVFPWGTFVVNVIGSFVFGLVTAAAVAGHLDSSVVAVVGTGFCGALTTYSTFGYETLRLVEDGARLFAVANVALSIGAGLGAAALGWTIGAAVT